MVDDKILGHFSHGLRSREASKLEAACNSARKHAASFSDSQIQEVADGLTSLFNLEPATHPEFAPVVSCAMDTLAAMGPKVVKVLVQDLADSDLDVNSLITQTLAKLGRPATVELIQEFRNNSDPYRRSTALFALSLINDPALIEVFPEVVSALDHDNPELRDTAARAIGNMVECLGGTFFRRSGQ